MRHSRSKPATADGPLPAPTVSTMLHDDQALARARAMFPPIGGDREKRDHRMLETAVTALAGMQMAAGAAATKLCAQPDSDAAIDELALAIGNQLWVFEHFLDVYRALRDKPEIVN